MKKAFLVSFIPMTRVVVDVSDDWENNGHEWEQIISEAIKEMQKDTVKAYLNMANIDEIKLDTECPYSKEWDGE